MGATKTAKIAAKKSAAASKAPAKPTRSPNGRTGKTAPATAKSGELKKTRDQFGRRLSGAAHFIGVVLHAAKAPMTSGAVLHAVNTLATEKGIAVRSGVSNQLNSLAVEGMAELVAGGWQLTKIGRSVWAAGKAQTRTELRKGKTLAEARVAYNKS